MSVCLKEEFDKYIPENYKSVIFDIAFFSQKYGYKTYLIGGIVRDLLLHKPIPDADIIIEGDAVDFCEKLEKSADCKIIAVQENLRTAKVKFKNGVETDIASTREEKYIRPGTLPEVYNIGCALKDDVKRRDFTINTLALNLSEADGKYFLTDFCGGYNDIKNKKIKILHDNSFIDDPSRIIRALKFQARFDFDIEEKTFDLMQKYLDNVNAFMPLERIKNELVQYFSIAKPGLYNKIIETKAYKLISDNPVLKYDETALNEVLSFDIFDKEKLWFIYILLLIINGNYAPERLNLTSYEKKVIKEIKNLKEESLPDINDKVMIYKKFNDKFDISSAVYYILTKDAAAKEFLNNMKRTKILVTGNDLINLGFTPSPYFNEIFEKILKEKLYGKLKTKEEEINFVKRFAKKEEGS